VEIHDEKSFRQPGLEDDPVALGPPSGMPFSEEEYAAWIRPEGGPLKHRRWKRPVLGKGSPKTVPKHVDEFFHRGAFERHEVRARHTHKAVLPFRGKGFKTGQGRHSGKK